MAMGQKGVKFHSELKYEDNEVKNKVINFNDNELLIVTLTP